MTPKTLTREEIEKWRVFLQMLCCEELSKAERKELDALCDLALAGLEAGERERILQKDFERGRWKTLEEQVAYEAGIAEHSPSPGAQEERMTPERAVDEFVEGFSRDYKAAIAERNPHSPVAPASDLVERAYKYAAEPWAHVDNWPDMLTAVANLATDQAAELARKDARIKKLIDYWNAERESHAETDAALTRKDEEIALIEQGRALLQEELARLVAQLTRKDEEIASLREALQGLVDGVVPEVNEKGAGGFLLARLSDARAALDRKEG